jgi:two-component system, cell cycle sensor histidine kinase DivJ
VNIGDTPERSASSQSNVNPSAPTRDYLDALVHPSAPEDALVRRRAVMAPRLFGSLIAICILPVFLVLRGVPTVREFVVLAGMMVPISTAYFLFRSGRREAAHILSGLALAGIATVVAANSGGIDSFAAIWLVLIPLQAAASGSRRVVVIAALLALGGVALLIMAGPWLSFAPPTDRAAGTLAALGIVSASLCATGIALGADSVTHAGSWLIGLEEDQCRLLAGDMTDVITRHGRNGRVLFASPNAQAALGPPAGDLLGYGLFERIHIADRPAYLTALSDAAAAGESAGIETCGTKTCGTKTCGTKTCGIEACGIEACGVEFRLRHTVNEGGAEAVRFIWVEMRCRPLDTRVAAARDGGEVVAVLRDVTIRKAHQEALIAARAEAERANAAKNRFLAVMSHELRTPLNAIIGFSEMLRNETQIRVDADRRQEYARLINESGFHLLAVVNEILEMSRLETGDFEITLEPFKLAAVMVSCHELLSLRAQDAGVALRCDAPASLPDIVADKRAVKQILINLISNAIKFTERDGTVNIAARVAGADILLSVEDTGIGIADDDLARIGDPFYQARGNYARRHDGAGLGLSIVKGLVKLHGGDLEIRSRPGQGTRIVVRLPRDGECPAVAAGAPDAAPACAIASAGASQPRAELEAPAAPRAADAEYPQPFDAILQRRA